VIDHLLALIERIVLTSRHLAKAIRHLNAIMTHFEPMYDIEFDVYDICCDELKNDGSTKFFKSVAAIIK